MAVVNAARKLYQEERKQSMKTPVKTCKTPIRTNYILLKWGNCEVEVTDC